MTEEKHQQLQAELQRLGDVTGPVLVRPCCPLCHRIYVTHPATGLTCSHGVKATHLENHVEALRELSTMLNN